jgi:hypothetical protein
MPIESLKKKREIGLGLPWVQFFYLTFNHNYFPFPSVFFDQLIEPQSFF